ncbi:hypothetical protein Pan241w_11090 [Gimesia alba]|uniref:Uncharacterized protein n=1 Tax=Gimesia alba TaxID=2527973 RepID=A0A517RAY8_9PLAN|nr:hypothetical protein Pan241w_11090 [Gimesia alba]
MNHEVYQLVTDLLEACGGRRNKYRDRLDLLAETLGFSSDSAVCRIIRKREPLPHQIRYVAREIATKAVDRHFEL